MWDVKEPTPMFEMSRGPWPPVVWDWVGMAPCMGVMSPVGAHSLWAGLCPEKLVKLKTKN